MTANKNKNKQQSEDTYNNDAKKKRTITTMIVNKKNISPAQQHTKKNKVRTILNKHLKKNTT